MEQWKQTNTDQRIDDEPLIQLLMA